VDGILGTHTHRALGQLTPLTLVPPPPISDPKPAQLQRSDAAFGLIHEYRLAARPGRMRFSALTGLVQFDAIPTMGLFKVIAPVDP
jgi:hypothetical protein